MSTVLPKQEVLTIFKEELAEVLTADVRVTKGFAEEVLEGFANATLRIAKEHKADFNIAKLGAMKVKEVPEREYRNPQVEGQTVIKPAHLALSFKSSTSTKAALA